MGNTLATLPFGITLKEFAHLEEKHHKDSLGKLRLCTWQEADAESTYSGYSHEEMFIEHLALSNALPCFMERFVAY